MPHGFYTIEQWKARSWTPVLHLDAYQSLTKATHALQTLNRPGLFRITQTQRCIWAQTDGDCLRLHASHASSPEGLAELAQLFDLHHGRRPVEQARQQRAQAKARRKSGGKHGSR